MQKYSSATLCCSHHQDEKMDVNQVVPVFLEELDWQGTGERKKKETDGERECVHNHLKDTFPKKWSSVSL